MCIRDSLENPEVGTIGKARRKVSHGARRSTARSPKGPCRDDLALVVALFVVIHPPSRPLGGEVVRCMLAQFWTSKTLDPLLVRDCRGAPGGIKSPEPECHD